MLPGGRRSALLPWLLLGAPMPALLVGIEAMRRAGVPSAAWLINIGAAAAGLLLFALIRYGPRSSRPSIPFVLGALAIAAIILPFGSAGMLGVHRWVTLGGIRLHAAAIVAPLLIACVAAIARRQAAVAVAVAALVTAILALQPDAAQAVSFAAACITLIALHPTRRGYRIAGAIVLAAAAAISFTRPDPLAPIPHVEGIFALVASRGPAWAVLGVAALVLLPLPFFAVFARDRNRLALALGVHVAMTILSTLWGAFPVPVMGYGASPILGYFLALAFCRKTQPARATPSSPVGPSPSARLQDDTGERGGSRGGTATNPKRSRPPSGISAVPRC